MEIPLGLKGSLFCDIREGHLRLEFSQWFSRMIGWWLHCLNVTGERPGKELMRLLGMENIPSQEEQPTGNSPPVMDEFTRSHSGSLAMHFARCTEG